VVDELNGERLPAYHRLDVGADYTFVQRKTRHTLKFGVYNIYNRKNPLYITVRNKFQSESPKWEVVQVSLLPVFPTLRYLLEFK
jgi:hypothetical protein